MERISASAIFFELALGSDCVRETEALAAGESNIRSISPGKLPLDWLTCDATLIASGAFNGLLDVIANAFTER